MRVSGEHVAKSCGHRSSDAAKHHCFAQRGAGELTIALATRASRAAITTDDPLAAMGIAAWAGSGGPWAPFHACRHDSVSPRAGHTSQHPHREFYLRRATSASPAGQPRVGGRHLSSAQSRCRQPVVNSDASQTRMRSLPAASKPALEGRCGCTVAWKPGSGVTRRDRQR